jgi:hypothetical protein
MRNRIRTALRAYLKARTEELLPRTPLHISSRRSFLPSDAVPPSISVTTGAETVEVLADSPRTYRRTLEVTVMGVLVGSRNENPSAEFESALEGFGERLERIVSEFHVQSRLPIVNWSLTSSDLDVVVRSSVDMGGYELVYEAQWDSDEAVEQTSDLDEFRTMELRHAS